MDPECTVLPLFPLISFFKSARRRRFSPRDRVFDCTFFAAESITTLMTRSGGALFPASLSSVL
jgi:hypothetical protein